MKYLVIEKRITGEQFVEEFEKVKDAIECGQRWFDELADEDLKKVSELYVLESVNEHEMSDHHFDGDVVMRWVYDDDVIPRGIRPLSTLLNEFPQFFKNCKNGFDVKNLIDEKHTSREFNYLSADMSYSTNKISDLECSDVANVFGQERCRGVFNFEIGTRNITQIKVFGNVYLEDYDNEEEIYLEESFEMIGWKYANE